MSNGKRMPINYPASSLLTWSCCMAPHDQSVPHAVQVLVLFAGRWSFANRILEPITVSPDALWVPLDIDDLDPFLGVFPVALALDGHISTVLVELINVHSSPGPHKQAFAFCGTVGHVFRNSDGPLVVEIRARVRVFANEMERIAAVCTQTELAVTATMARLVELTDVWTWFSGESVHEVFLQSWAPESNLICR